MHLIKPLVTEKSQREEKNGRYVFVVGHAANTIAIAKEFETVYGVKVASVRVLNVPPKYRIGKTRAPILKRAPYKKAFIATKGQKTVDLHKLFVK